MSISTRSARRKVADSRCKVSLSTFEQRIKRIGDLALGSNQVGSGLLIKQAPRIRKVTVVELAEFDLHLIQEIMPHQHGNEAGTVGKKIGRIPRRSLAVLFRMPVQ